MTEYTTKLTVLIDESAIEEAHDYLVTIRPPTGTRYFGDAPNRSADGRDYLYISTVMRPETADAYRQCADAVAGVSILPSVSPWVDVAAYPALPDEGDPVEAGAIYDDGGALWMARQDHTRTIYPPEDTLALFMRYRDAAEGSEWIAAESVEVGDARTYEGRLYRAVQAHVTQPEWVPDGLPALWELLEVPDPDAEPEPGNAWAPGLAVVTGEIYTYQGDEYKVLQNHDTQTGWEPPAVPSLWELQQ